MKKLFLLFLYAVLPAVVFGAANNIKMVTYFPVPYVSYNQVDVSKALDVGVMTCDLSLGCATGKPALNVYSDKSPGNDMVKKGYLRVTSGRLDLDSSSSVGKAITNKMFVGGNTTDTTLIGSTGEMSFEQNLRITKQTNRGQSLQATTESNTLTALKLFPANIKNNFPDCTGVDGAPDVSWQTLEVGNEGENVFMVCGKGKEGAASCEDSYTPFVSTTNLTIGEANALDTCDGNGDYSFTCGASSKGKTCTDYDTLYPLGSTGGGKGIWVDYGIEGPFNVDTTTPLHYVAFNPGTWPTLDFSYTKSTCTASVVSKMYSGGPIPSATEMCKLQCQGRPNLCDSSCRVVTACQWWKDGQRPSGWGYDINVGASRCSEWRLKCTEAATPKFATNVRTVKCCD